MSRDNRPDVKAELKGIFKAAVGGTTYEPGKSSQQPPSYKATPKAQTADDYIIQRLIADQSKPREKKPWWKKFQLSGDYNPDAGYARPMSD